ncbi:MAG TPA: hypothetical protein EYO58_08915 [Flavobacteriales bacterium]|nr:hypothetical protein [Flavobacteriales bacterium]
MLSLALFSGLGEGFPPLDDEGDGDWPPVSEGIVLFVTFVLLEMSVVFAEGHVPFVTFVALIVPFEYCDETWDTNRTNNTIQFIDN